MKRLLPLLIALTNTGMLMPSSAQETLDRTIRPSPQPTPRLTLPAIQKEALSNGLNVWLVEHHELPLVAFNLVLISGSDRDPAAMNGLSSMTAELLDEGTQRRDALQIADELETIGADLRVFSGLDGSYVTLNCLTRHLEPALDVFADVLVNPTFPEKEFVRLRAQRKTSLMQQRDRAATIASLAFNKVLYGPDHPYGGDPSGTENSLTAMTREDLVRFYQTYYRPGNGVLIVVGDITMGRLRNLLEPRLGAWKSGAPPPVPAARTPASTGRTVYLIDKPGAPQSEIRIGYPAVARDTPEYFPLVLANRMLGGQFASRLNLNIREKRGFSYGVRSSFSFNKQPGPFTASGGVFAAKTDSALQEFMFEIDRIHAEGITPEELEFVKKGLNGSFALGFETPGQIAGSLQGLVLYNLPDDYFSNYLQNIDRVSLEDVKRVSRQYFDSSRMAVLVVGDLQQVRPGIEALNLGPVVLCDVDGVPIPR